MVLAKLFSHRSVRNDAGIFRQIPLAAKGHLYVSPMPHGAYDTRNRLLALYREHRIRHVVILATDEEIRRKARRDLRRDYEAMGATHSQLSVPDMTAPDVASMAALAGVVRDKLASGNVAIHCHAGVGRTSAFTCCVVQVVNHLSPEESIAFVKRHMEVNMTAEQVSVVIRFGRDARPGGPGEGKP